MNIVHLFQLQKELDNKIIEKRGLQNVPLFQEKKLSFRDELSELLHVWRGHKYWSANNKPITKAVRNEGQMMEEDKEYYNPLLDEFVDALHFALSIGLEREWNKYIDAFVVRNSKGNTKTEIIDVFNDLYENKLWTAAHYKTLMNDLAYLGAALGFSAIEIYNAYLEKIKSIMIVRHPVTKRRRNGGKIQVMEEGRNSVFGALLGIYSIKHMAKKFGRSVDAVKLKAQRIGLGDARLHFEGITILQLSEVIGVDYNCIKSWGKRFGFPIKLKLFSAEQK